MSEVEQTGMEITEDDGAFGFEIHDYIDRYEGYTKLARLGFIIEHCPSLREEALRILVNALKACQNTSFYRKIYKTLDLYSVQDLPPELKFDEEWLLETEKNLAVKLEVLAADLLSAKNSMVKEAIRMSHNDLGHLNYQVGNLNEALRCYLRTRDFNTMPRHHCEMCLNVITVSVDLNQFFNVSNFVNKLADIGLGDGDVGGSGGVGVVEGKVKAASGLVALNDLQFAHAARLFLGVNAQLENKFRQTITAEDIGVYGAITALATLSRPDLKKLLFDNKTFTTTYLEMSPKLLHLVQQFQRGELGSVLRLLGELKPRLMMDIHMAQHAERLLAMISDRCLLLYFAPYSTVDLNRMAAHMQLTAAELEQRLVALISTGLLSARIDAKSRTLIESTQDLEQAAIEKVLSLSTQHARAMRRDILRLSMMQQGFVVEVQMPGAASAGGLVMAGKRGRKVVTAGASAAGANSKALSIMGAAGSSDSSADGGMEGADDNEDDYEEPSSALALMDGEDDLDDYEVEAYGAGSAIYFPTESASGGAADRSEASQQPQEMNVDRDEYENSEAASSGAKTSK